MVDRTLASPGELFPILWQQRSDQVASFTDGKKRTWAIAVDLTTLRRVRDELNLNLVEIFSGDLLDRLAGDPLLLGELLWLLCAKQAAERGIEPEQFGELAGDAIEDATRALEVALADFFPTRKRSALMKWISKRDRIFDLAMKAAERDLESDQAEMLLSKILEEPMAGSIASSTSAMSSPRSPASIPGPSPSADC